MGLRTASDIPLLHSLPIWLMVLYRPGSTLGGATEGPGAAMEA